MGETAPSTPRARTTVGYRAWGHRPEFRSSGCLNHRDGCVLKPAAGGHRNAGDRDSAVGSCQQAAADSISRAPLLSGSATPIARAALDFRCAAPGCPGSLDLGRRPKLLGRRRVASHRRPAWGSLRFCRPGQSQITLAGNTGRLWHRPGSRHRDRHRWDVCVDQQPGFSTQLLQQLHELEPQPHVSLSSVVPLTATDIAYRRRRREVSRVSTSTRRTSEFKLGSI